MMKEALEIIHLELIRSNTLLNKILKLNELISRDLRYLHASISSPITLICRTTLDSWQGVIQTQIFQNEYLTTLVSKAQLLIEKDGDDQLLIQLIRQLSLVDASINDQNILNNITRPIDGLIPPSFDEQFIYSLDVHIGENCHSPLSWSAWQTRLETNNKLLAKFAERLPINHPIGTYPSTLYLLIEELISECEEQSRLVRTLEIISNTNYNDHGSFLRLEGLLISSKILPLPFAFEEE